METYASILIMAMPAFFGLVMIEKIYGYFWKKESFKPMDTIASLSSGFTNVIKDVLGISVSIISYDWLVRHTAITHIESTIWVYLIAFIALDFAGYWVHRMSHQINFFWNKHAVHHSSEEFNLACALRQSISSFVNLFTFFLLPAALLGVDAKVIAIVAPIHLFAQFWYHTTYIGRMGFLEKILVTPSHHRVHHAINPEYLDKNHSQIFIIWDKLFGTFKEEDPAIPPVYGITRPVRTWNPFKINFQHLFLLIKDAIYTSSWKDKWTIWFKPTGWRPADMEARFPVPKIENPYQYEKYNPSSSATLITWSWVQFFFTLSIMIHFFSRIGQYSLSDIFTNGAFLFVGIYAYTELMDKNPWAVFFQAIHTLFGFVLLWQMSSWFGDTTTWIMYGIGLYLSIALLAALYFAGFEFKWKSSNEHIFN